MQEPEQVKALSWAEDCLKWHGRVLRGPYSHYCGEWDELPIDCTTNEFAVCQCYRGRTFRLARFLSGKITNWLMARKELRDVGHW